METYAWPAPLPELKKCCGWRASPPFSPSTGVVNLPPTALLRPSADSWRDRVMAKVHRLSISGRFDQLERVCEFIEHAAREAGLGEEGVGRCQLAADEACTNIIEHGYGGEGRGT